MMARALQYNNSTAHAPCAHMPLICTLARMALQQRNGIQPNIYSNLFVGGDEENQRICDLLGRSLGTKCIERCVE